MMEVSEILCNGMKLGPMDAKIKDTVRCGIATAVAANCDV